MTNLTVIQRFRRALTRIKGFIWNPTARPRVRRRYGRYLVGVMLLACMAFCVLWVRSYWRLDYFQWDYGRPNDWSRMLDATSIRGGVLLHYKALTATDATSRKNIADNFHWHPRGVLFKSGKTADEKRITTYFAVQDGVHPLGFDATLIKGNYRGTLFRDMTVSIPYWFPVALLLLFSAYRLWKRFRHRQESGGFPVISHSGTE